MYKYYFNEYFKIINYQIIYVLFSFYDYHKHNLTSIWRAIQTKQINNPQILEKNSNVG